MFMPVNLLGSENLILCFCLSAQKLAGIRHSELEDKVFQVGRVTYDPYLT